MQYTATLHPPTSIGTLRPTEISSVDIEMVVELITPILERGYTLDPKLTSSEILKQVGQDPTQGEPQIPEEPSEEEEIKESQIRPKREEFLQKTYETIKMQMPTLTNEDFLKMEVSNGEYGKVGPNYFYYHTSNSPQEVAETLIQHTFKENKNN